MIDRIVHHADVLALRGACYRLRGRGIDSLPGIRTTAQTDTWTADTRSLFGRRNRSTFSRRRQLGRRTTRPLQRFGHEVDFQPLAGGVLVDPGHQIDDRVPGLLSACMRSSCGSRPQVDARYRNRQEKRLASANKTGGGRS